MRNTKQQPQPLVFRNNAAIGLWAFWTAWMLLVAGYTYMFLSDYLFRDLGGEFTWMGLPIVFFWIYGLRGCKHAFSQPRVWVELGRHSVLVRQMFPWTIREDRFAVSSLSVSDVIEGKDGEGDPYFKCNLELPDKRSLTIAESGSRPDVDANRARLLTALGMADPRAAASLSID